MEIVNKALVSKAGLCPNKDGGEVDEARGVQKAERCVSREQARKAMECVSARLRPDGQEKFREVSTDELRKIMGEARWRVVDKNDVKGQRRLKVLEGYRKSLNEVMRCYQINIPAKQAAFLATVGEETGGLTQMTEGRSRHASSRSLYKGRGIIQLTGRSNYAQASRALRVGTPPKYDALVKHPASAAGSKLSFKIAGWYWSARKHAYGIPNNKMGEQPRADLRDFREASSLINSGRPDGPINGWGQRLTYYKRALKTLGIDISRKMEGRLNDGIRKWSRQNLPAEKSYFVWRAAQRQAKKNSSNNISARR